MGKTYGKSPLDHHQVGVGGEGGCSNSVKLDGGSHRITFVNFVLCILCFTSLGASFYSNFRQSHIEDRIRHLRHLDDRITILEAKLSNSQYQAAALNSGETEFTDVANVVRKLSLQVAGIQRLRRDVSHLQLSRRSQRQASIQQSPECVCPAGNHDNLYKILFVNFNKTT